MCFWTLPRVLLHYSGSHMGTAPVSACQNCWLSEFEVSPRTRGSQFDFYFPCRKVALPGLLAASATRDVDCIFLPAAFSPSLSAGAALNRAKAKRVLCLDFFGALSGGPAAFHLLLAFLDSQALFLSGFFLCKNFPRSGRQLRLNLRQHLLYSNHTVENDRSRPLAFVALHSQVGYQDSCGRRTF